MAVEVQIGYFDGMKPSRRALIVAAAAMPQLVAAHLPAAAQGSQEWAKLPKMVLERQYAGPLQDTVIQRLRDPADGTICYLYLPISVAHTAPASSGFVQYGANSVGSINCLPPATGATGKR